MSEAVGTKLLAYTSTTDLVCDRVQQEQLIPY